MGGSLSGAWVKGGTDVTFYGHLQLLLDTCVASSISRTVKLYEKDG